TLAAQVLAQEDVVLLALVVLLRVLALLGRHVRLLFDAFELVFVPPGAGAVQEAHDGILSDASQPSEFSRSTRRSRNSSARMSTPTCAFGFQSVRRRTSTYVRPRLSSGPVSILTARSSVSSRSGRATCATATASWIGEPSQPYCRRWNSP